MKRTISTLLLVLLCLTPITTRYLIQETYGAECEDSCSDPVQLTRMIPAILGASSGSGGCDSASNEIGYRFTAPGASSSTKSAGSAQAQRWAADCSGTLNVSHFYHASSSTTTNIDICVYATASGTESTPGSNTKIGCTGDNTVDFSLAGQVAFTGAIAGSVVKDTVYWVIYFNTGASDAKISYDTVNNQSASSTACAPSGDITSCSWSGLTTRSWDLYVDIK